MAKVIVGMTLSLDGFVEDANASVGQLYNDLADLHDQPVLQESIRNTGAVIMGRHAFAMGDADAYAGNYEYQVPIFVLAHQQPSHLPPETDTLKWTFVTDGIESAVRQAKAAAGDRDVTVIGGASVLQQVLQAGLADELHIDIMPVLLGDGLRLFEHLDAQAITLEKISVAETGARTHLKFRIVKPTA